MVKSYLEFKQAEEAIKLAEDVLMRPLTDDEKEMIIVKGFKALMEGLEIEQSDWQMLKEVKQVLAAYTTGNEDEFMETLAECPNARELFEFICASYAAMEDMGEACENPAAVKEPVDPIQDAVERMKSGETVDLDNEQMNKVCQYLAENFMNYMFRSVNGKSSLKL